MFHCGILCQGREGHYYSSKIDFKSLRKYLRNFTRMFSYCRGSEGKAARELFNLMLHSCVNLPVLR